MYCAKLKFDFAINTPDFPIENFKGNRPTQFNYDIKKIDAQLLKFLYKRGISVIWTEIFYSPPSKGFNIHVDNPKLQHYTKLNICISDDHSYMKWYKVKPEFINKPTALTEIGTPYAHYEKNEVDLLHTECINGTYLVNAAIPHESTNDTDKDRWTLSLGLGYKTDSDWSLELPFEEACSRLKSIII